MRIVSKKECHSWVSSKARIPFSWSALAGVYGHSAAYLLPRDAGRRTAVARELSALIDRSGEGLLWITEWGASPSSENMPLFHGYRRSLQEDRPLGAAPGHLFEDSDIRELECLLDLVLYFFWSASLIDAGSTWLRITHELLTVHTRDSAVLTSWQASLAGFELAEFQVSRPQRLLSVPSS